VAYSNAAKVQESQDRGEEGLKLNGFETGRVVECRCCSPPCSPPFLPDSIPSPAFFWSSSFHTCLFRLRAPTQPLTGYVFWFPRMINMYELIHVLKDTIIFMDQQLQKANGQVRMLLFCSDGAVDLLRRHSGTVWALGRFARSLCGRVSSGATPLTSH